MRTTRLAVALAVLSATMGNPPPAMAVPPKITAAFNPASAAAWWRSKGGDAHFSPNQASPAILLVHGVNQSALCWTKPSIAAGVGEDYAYSYDEAPAPVKVDGPNVGFYKWGYSPQLKDIDSRNWFSFLKARGFTVATWSQPPDSDFNAAYPGAVEALEKLAEQTAALNPAAPVPIALVGHSRGGLLIRKLLKDKKDLDGRVRWAITIHSPHQGSQMGLGYGEMGAEIVDLLDAAVPVSINVLGKKIDLTSALKRQLKDIAIEAFRPVNKLLGMQMRQRELIPGGPLLRDLKQGESKVPGVDYFTFGGTSPRYFRLYLWVFDDDCLVSTRCWARPAELTLVSPLFDKIRQFAPEIAAGKGDGLVTDVSSRLPWSRHETNNLNHAEIFWNVGLQQKVAQILSVRIATPQARPVKF